MPSFRPIGIYTDKPSGTPVKDFTFPNPENSPNEQDTNNDPHLPTASLNDRQATNLGYYPVRDTVGIGFYEADDGFTRAGQGIITELINWKMAIFVKPASPFWGPGMLYPVRIDDLVELEKTQPADGQVEETIELGRYGYGLWMSPENNLMFGYGEIMQVARDAKVAVVDKVAVDFELFAGDGPKEGRGVVPKTGFFRTGDAKSEKVEMRFRST